MCSKTIGSSTEDKGRIFNTFTPLAATDDEPSDESEHHSDWAGVHNPDESDEDDDDFEELDIPDEPYKPWPDRFILTASQDYNIYLHRLTNGVKIAQFGQENYWNIYDMSLYQN